MADAQEGGELEPRVSALEGEMREMRAQLHRSEQDVAAARILAGAADRDVGEIRAELRDFRRATVASSNAVREDLGDLRRGIVDLRREFVDLRDDVGTLRGELRSKFDMTAAGHEQIVGMLQTLIDRDEGS